MQNSTMDLFDDLIPSRHSEMPVSVGVGSHSMTEEDAQKLRHFLSSLFSIATSPQNLKKLSVELEDSFMTEALELASSIPNTQDQKRVIKVRRLPQLSMVGIYDSGIGSALLTQVRRNSECFVTLEASVVKHRFFSPSYLDDVYEIRLPAAIWRDGYCGDKLATDPDKIINVPVVSHRSRSYVITSTLYSTDYHEGNAWALSPAPSAKDRMHTYDQLIKQMDTQGRERGDLRGLAVRGNGTICVLDSLHKFVDDRR